MNLRNLGIVFSSTLQMPAAIFTVMVVDFAAVFSAPEPRPDQPPASGAEDDVFDGEAAEEEGALKPPSSPSASSTLV